jgi:membrane protein
MEMLANFDMAISWSELVKRTYREMMEDDALGLAAQLAYYCFLALFPAILCVIAIASFFPLHQFTDQIVAALGRVAPEQMLQVVRTELVRLADNNNGGVLGVGLLGALWSSSSALVSAIDAMNRAYDIEEGRPWWRVRVTAVALTLGLAVFIVMSFALVITGPQLADWVAARFAFGDVFVWSWKILQWPIAFALVVSGIGMVYYFAPDAEQDWVWITPGSLIAAVLWLVGTLAFRFYVVNFGSYEATYGAVAGVILLLLWFYLSALVIIIGAEVSAEIEHAAPWAKAPGEKVPGQKRKIGSAAARAFRDAGHRPPLPVPGPVAVISPEPSFLERAGACAIVLIRWKNRQRQ